MQGTALDGWFTLGAPGPMDNILFFVLGCSLSIIVSGLVYTLFERPVMKLTSKWRRGLFSETNAQLRPGPIKPAIW